MLQDALILHVLKAYPSWAPSVILDIGANIGMWSTAAGEAWRYSKLILVEATLEHAETLNQAAQELGNATSCIAVLSSRNGQTVSFYEDGNTGNSMFKEQTEHYANSKPENRTTTTLDTLIHNLFSQQKTKTDQYECSPPLFLSHENDSIDYVKLDVQGAELLVLLGGTNILRKTTFVQLETSLTEYNLGGSCHFEVDAFLRSMGFYLYYLGNVVTAAESFKTKGMGSMDVLYVNPTSSRLPKELQDLQPNFCGSRLDRGDILKSYQNKLETSNCMTVSFSWGDYWHTWISGCTCGIILTIILGRLKRRRVMKDKFYVNSNTL